MYYPLIILLLSLWGVFLCIKIYKEKHKKKPLVCPLGADCETVVKSEFSSFFGIGLEVFGILYYLFIGLGYLAVFLYEPFYNIPVLFILYGASAVAFIFSLYLTFVQAFYLKSWCTWCLTSAGISTLIFGISTYGILIHGIDFVPLLATLKPLILIMHLVGFALGVGGATINDVLFFRFLKDFRISEAENSVLKIMSQMIWFGLMLAIISGIGLYLPNAEALNESSKFLVKVIVVLVITINGAFLNLVIAPNLTKISFKNDGANIKRINSLRKVAFISGGISFVSWYTAFILGTFKSVPLTFEVLLSLYVFLLIIASVGGYLFEKKYCASSPRQK